ncbi:hypothetical protein NLU13_8646 [Sarocladium strictum]|uniref:Uncharacterized protein n=1 Tax=Sarocladium strictum TaxID=5046 RepID=A0AA39L5C4_SARSR|nr:hypothetical protein NLU13_8646 [Sarocladium strictum]
MARRRRPPRAGALTELPPLRIAAQIASLQALYYSTACILLLFTSLVSGAPFRFKMILGWDYMRGDNTQGWLLALVWLLDGGFFMSVAIVALVARSKLVPDFALTIHGLHVVFVTLATRSLPRHGMWWFTMLASSALSTALGIWGCRYRELQPIFFGGGGASAHERRQMLRQEPPDLEEGEDELGRRVSAASEEIEMTKLEPRPV